MVSREVRQRFWEGVRSGLWAVDAAVAAGVSPGLGQRLVAERGGVMEPRTRRSGRYLDQAEREEIAILYAQEMGVREIGRRIGRPHTTVSRELDRNGNRDGSYRAGTAQARAEQRARRPKPGKLVTHPRLRGYVADKLATGQWSPQQIAQRLRREFGDDESMRCCHETIYRSLYVQGRGELRRELAAQLRTRREQRKAQHRPERRKGRLVETVHISQRPAEAADRAVPGHWEGDLILGKAGGSAIGTLVERSTRFVMLVALPNGHKADLVADAIAGKITTLPAALTRTLTWDQGHEMAEHVRFTEATGVEVYFCDPKSPWQRGSNENTNGLLRQYLPRTLDFKTLTQADLDAIADQLNERPRQTLGFKTPSQALAEVLR
jgi:transposase, IS30 family